MGEPTKELLDLPFEPKPPSFIESLFAGKEQQHKEEGKRKAGPPTDPLPKSQVLEKVKDFLGEMAKANEKLQLDAQNKPPEEYDIEALTGNEKEYIEMDLLLGVADLHSEQAIDAAEATMSGFPPSGRSFASSSSDSEMTMMKMVVMNLTCLVKINAKVQMNRRLIQPKGRSPIKDRRLLFSIRILCHS